MSASGEGLEKKEVKKVFEKEVECPVCNGTTMVKVVISRHIRIESRDTDFMINYREPNPYFYNIWVCTGCGYASPSSRFSKIGKLQTERINEGIRKKWKGKKNYPEQYTVDTAIEMHKLALLNSAVKEEKDSAKAHICLETAWLYRIKKDEANEHRFLKQALKGFLKTYKNEDLPVVGLDKPSLTYLIGELYRRTGDRENALRWFGMVLADRYAKKKIKDMARDQKDLII